MSPGYGGAEHAGISQLSGAHRQLHPIPISQGRSQVRDAGAGVGALPAPFSTVYTKAQIKAIGKKRVRPSVTQGGDGDKERGHKPRQTRWEGNQPSVGRGPLTGVKPGASKSHSTKLRSSNEQHCHNPDASCPGKPRSHGETSHPVAAFQQGSRHSGQQRAPGRPRRAPEGEENICCIPCLLILLPALTHSNSKLNPEAQ